MNFKHFSALYRGERIDPVIVCNIDQSIAELIGARVTKVLLSADTLKKQAYRHGELDEQAYLTLPVALRYGEYRQESARSAVILFVDTKNLDFGVRVHLKVTPNGKEIYADSFCLLRRKTYAQALAKPLKVIREHRRI